MLAGNVPGPDLRHRKQIQVHTVGGLIGEVIDEQERCGARERA